MQDFYLISVLSLRKVFNYDMLSHTLTLPICELHQPRHKVGHAYRIFILTYNIFLLHSNLTKYLASLMGFGTRFYRQRFPFLGPPCLHCCYVDQGCGRFASAFSRAQRLCRLFKWTGSIQSTRDLPHTMTCVGASITDSHKRTVG